MKTFNISLLTSVICLINLSAVIGQTVTGSGTLNTIPRFTSTGSTIGNSIVTQDAGATTITVGGILGVTGITNLTSNLNINTNKFNVTATTGNTTIGGTLGVTGNFTVGSSNPFFVNSSTGSIGIGNNSPSQELDIRNNSGSGTAAIRLENYQSQGYFYYGWDILNNSVGSLQFNSGTSSNSWSMNTIMTLDYGTYSSPRVGIGCAISTTYMLALGGSLGVTGATSLSNTLNVTGATTLSSTLGVTGNLSVNTNKFQVTAATGATTIAGTLTVNSSIGSASGSDLALASNGSANKITFTTNSTERMRITSSGQVLINSTCTSLPADLQLGVSGTIYATAVNVKNTSCWSDFVFKKDYNLKSLSEVENYVNQNKHLPEVPSANEIGEKGINLGDMDALLLKKIEELTLYVIEQNKKIIAQDKKIEVLQKQVNNQ